MFHMDGRTSMKSNKPDLVSKIMSLWRGLRNKHIGIDTYSQQTLSKRIDISVALGYTVIDKKIPY